MCKFKIGDRVRVLPRDKALAFSGHGATAGKEYTVKAVRGDAGDNIDTELWSFFDHEIEPTFTIEPGKFYRTRNGKVTGRVSKGDTGFEAVVDGRVRIFDKAGGAVHGDDDIVEAWVPKVGERVVVVKTDNFHPAVSSETECVVDGVTGNAIRLDASTESAGVLHQLAYLSDLEPLPVAVPQPAALKIEAGRYYKTRDGRKVGPLMTTHLGSGLIVTLGDGRVWEFDGSARKACEAMSACDDLVAEWPEPSLTGSPAAPTPVSAQVDAINEEYGSPAAGKLLKTGQGYGYELARFGGYVWVDIGKTAPITIRADKIAA
ncbi:hypothetical protein [Shinella zoogloeoides]|uniref:hypothetical protein n=1 Tax=Shinella zoogloeoides TaxID=352475 RepID=UPI001F5ABC2D|nr:hypothetical protein [Shinella zoogloeoides]